ncbi:MAG: hypothetical protein ACLR8Y_03730 [Alistipes indistinctus]
MRILDDAALFRAHVYTGNFLQGCPAEHQWREYANRAGVVAIERQVYPNSPNREHFLRPGASPGDSYNEKIVFRFEIWTSNLLEYFNLKLGKMESAKHKNYAPPIAMMFALFAMILP